MHVTLVLFTRLVDMAPGNATSVPFEPSHPFIRALEVASVASNEDAEMLTSSTQRSNRAPVDLTAEPDVIALCPDGTYECGAEWCTPNGGVCCASVGYPDGYCNSGSTCCPDGTCSSSGACDGGGGEDGGGEDGGGEDGGGGGSCDWDATDCGGGCCPSGSVCGATGSGQCCAEETPYHCPSEGVCYELPGSCGGGGGASSGGGSGGASDGGNGGSGYVCASASTPTGICAAIEYCVDESEPCRGYYSADGQRFECSNACDDSSLASCAQSVVDYCEGSGYADSSGVDDSATGCRVAEPARPWLPASFAFLTCVLLRRRWIRKL